MSEAMMIKAVCIELQEELGGNKVVAKLAGVSQSVWSDYVNFDKPDCTIPGHRMMRLENATKRRDFSRLFADRLEDEQEPKCDLLALAASALSAIAQIEAHLAQVHAHGGATQREKRELITEVERLRERAHDLGACIEKITAPAVTAIRGGA